MSRIANDRLRDTIMSADDAAALITSGSSVGLSKFAGSG